MPEPSHGYIVGASTEAARGGYNYQANHAELCRRPLRRAVRGTPSDAAGVLTGQKTGKSGRLRGTGVPPASEKEWQYHPSKHFVPGKSFISSVSGILQQRETGAPPGTAARTSVRVFNAAYQGHLSGGAAAVITEAEVRKPVRRPGSAGPRTEQVLTTIRGGDGQAQPTYALLDSARRELFVTSRPKTSPACLLITKPQMRAGYDIGRSSHVDVLQYRHSNGICPSEFKLVAERPSAPQLATPSRQEARENFFDSRNSYLLNKMRSQKSDVIIVC